MTDATSNGPPADLYFGNRIPFLGHIGLVPDTMVPDRVVARMPFRPELTNSAGVVHGGAIMAALDFAMSVAARSSDPDNLLASTVDMRTSFIRAGQGDLVVEGRCLHRGRSIAFCEASARNEADEIVATASGTFKFATKKRP
jgi:uncharacterized protein (TIGR00369 family)